MTRNTFMKLASITIIISGVFILTLSAFGYYYWYKPALIIPADKQLFSFNLKKDDEHGKIVSRLKQKALLARDYVVGHSYNNEVCFLVDMRIPSGKNRFFVYNLKRDSVEIAGLVTHGSGSEIGTEELNFSNIPNSYCTSLGKYKLGNSYAGKFGLAYKLYGLENSNSNAFDRFVVLHGHDCVPDDEVAPQTICLSLGCPTVSPAFLTKLKTYLDSAGQPIMLWIYY